MRFEYWKTADDVWTWQLKSSLGEVVARGTPLTSRESCLTAIKLVKLAASAACRDVTPEQTTDPALVAFPNGTA